MPHDLLEEIRLLANIETETAKLLQVVMLGQPELAARLNDPSLRQLKQRVAIRCALRPLDLRSTAAMIAGRIRVAGGKPAETFTPRAIELIYVHSGGIPRTINVICDNALLHGFAADVKPVGAEVIEEVSREFDLANRSDAPVLQTVGPAPSLADSAAPVTPARPRAAGPLSGAASANGSGVAPPVDTRRQETTTATSTAAPELPAGTNEALPSPAAPNTAFSPFGKRRRFPFLGWVRG